MNSFLLLLTHRFTCWAWRLEYSTEWPLHFLHLLWKQWIPAPAPISRYNLCCDELMCDSPRKHVGSLRIHRNAREEQLRNPESVIGFLLQGLGNVPQEILIQSFAFCRDATFLRNTESVMTSEAYSFPMKRVNYPEIIFSVIHDFAIDLEHCHNPTNPLWTHSWSRLSILLWPQVWTTLSTKTLSWHGNLWTAALGGRVRGSEEMWGQLGLHSEFKVTLGYVHRGNLL